ncbi:hypothetical protein [Arsenicibacter rosenii]|uniref:Uncharacterized protein n=1 Tax=Arsenicibacter rosenii TaxID=1750698 RepID=A0A1S2VAL1_9BACT|nr:hypothetical protein [Arsenicibacter rosenii]OIN55733.1 hypothetical protein BLX24_28370 [Arsenicibacter rosenii]
MTKYEVGQPFPHPEYRANGTEGAKIMTTSAFFDILFYSSQPAADRETVTKKPLKYGIYQKDNVPFFLLEFNGEFSVDAPMNINKVDNSAVEEWLNSNGNLVTIYLIDARTNIIHGIRAIGLRHDVAELMRDICEKQDEQYASVGQVDKVIDQISRTMTTEAMIRRATMHRL